MNNQQHLSFHLVCKELDETDIEQFAPHIIVESC